MILDDNDINKGKLTHLLAPDLFWNGTKQVFSAKTGKFAGYTHQGREYLIPEQDDQPPEPPPVKLQNQLSLF